MTSDKKREANRRNARKSTGPRTPEGKSAVRLNAFKHGLLSQEVLLPWEDGEAFQELGEHLRAELQPVGVLQHLHVDRVIAAYWRLRRVNQVEVGLFAWGRSEELRERANREINDYLSSELHDIIIPTSTEITDEKKREEALSKAQQIRSEQESEIATLGRIFARDADKANAFSKLSRYETTIERGLYKALHELERRQAARRGGDVPAPLAVDVDVSGINEGDR